MTDEEKKKDREKKEGLDNLVEKQAVPKFRLAPSISDAEMKVIMDNIRKKAAEKKLQQQQAQAQRQAKTPEQAQAPVQRPVHHVRPAQPAQQVHPAKPVEKPKVELKIPSAMLEEKEPEQKLEIKEQPKRDIRHYAIKPNYDIKRPVERPKPLEDDPAPRISPFARAEVERIVKAFERMEESQKGFEPDINIIRQYPRQKPDETKEILEELPRFSEEIESEFAKKIKETKQKRETKKTRTPIKMPDFTGVFTKRNASIMLIILVVVLFSTFAFIKFPNMDITGKAVEDFTIDASQSAVLDQYITSSKNLSLNLKSNKTQFKSLGLSGSFIGEGWFRIYLVNDRERLLVADSNNLKQKIKPSLGTVNLADVYFDSSIDSDSNNGMKIVLEYEDASDWDIENDGVAHVQDVIDFTVKNSVVPEDTSLICTRWTVNDNPDSNVCHGNNACCNFLGLSALDNDWNAPFHLHAGMEDVGKKNIVKARIIHFDTSDDLNITYTEEAALPAKFYQELYSFEDYCEGTCNITGAFVGDYKLVIEVIGDIYLTLDEMSYSVIQLAQVEEIAKDFPEIVLEEQYGWNGDYKLKDNYDGTFDLEVFAQPRAKQELGKSMEIISVVSKIDIDRIKKAQVNKLTPRIDEPNEDKITTEIFALQESFEFEKATLILRKLGPVNTIFYCSNFNVSSFICNDYWRNTDIPFEDDGNTITFTVDRFSAYAGGVLEEFEFSPAIRDANGGLVGYDIEFEDIDTKKLEKSEKITAPGKIKIKEGKYKIKISPSNHPIKSIEIYDVDIRSDIYDFINIDDVEETGQFSKYAEIYAIDPTKFNFNSATVTVTAKANTLYKCKEWDFNSQVCNGEWVKIMDLIPGQDYSFTLTPEDPAFAEINISHAQHLDSNYNFVSDIYNEVQQKDNAWSEKINNSEFVRATYQHDLENGNVIDVYARGDGSTWFEVYKANTTSPLLGTSKTFSTAGEWDYITMSNLTQPEDELDFKIRSTSNGYLEFDYIHDGINNIILHVTDAATGNEWTRSGGTNWSTALNTNDGTTSYGYVIAPSDYLIMDMDNTVSNYTILNVTVRANCRLDRDSGGEGGDIQLGHTTLGTDSGATGTVAWTTSWTNYTETWATNPFNSNNPWSWSDIPNLRVIVYSTKSGGSTKNLQWQCTYVDIEIATNTPPTQTKPILNSSPENLNQTGENLTVYTNTSDIDGDSVKDIINWYKNGKSMAVLYLPFEGGSKSSGTGVNGSAKDYSGQGNDVTFYPDLINDQYHTLYAPGGGYDGHGAMYIDRYAEGEVLNSTNLNFTGTFTFSYWIKPGLVFPNSSVIQTVFCKGGSYTPETKGYCSYLWGDKMVFAVYRPGTEFGLTSTQSLVNGSWYHVVGVYTNPGHKIYINGNLSNSYGSSIYAPSGYNLYINGEEGLSIGRGVFRAYLDELMIFNKSLTPEQIKALYESGYNKIVSQETAINDTWYACSTPNDGNDDGQRLCTDNLTVGPNIVPLVSLSAPANNSRINIYNINFSWTFNQDQSAYNILIDDNSNFASPEINVTNLTAVANHITSLSQTNKTYYWKVRANNTNGQWSSWSNTWQITTSTPPTSSTPILNSSSGTNQPTDNLTVYPQNLSDIDGDNIRTAIDWFRNGKTLMIFNMPFERAAAKDYSGYPNNGVLEGVTWNATGGHDNKGAFYFSGSDRITVLNHPELQSNGPFTISLWIKPASIGSDQAIMAKAATNQYGYEFSMNGSGTIWFDVKAPSASYGSPSITSVQAGQWYHIVGTYGNPGSKLYINGQLEYTNALTAYSSHYSNLVLADGSYGFSRFHGTIDDVQIYNHSLSEDQIKALYENKTDTIVSQETSLNDIWQACVTPIDQTSDGLTRCSNNLTIVILGIYPYTPANNSELSRYNINFSWIFGPAQSAYQILVDDNSNFASPEINVTNSTGNKYHIATLSQTSTTYYWKVRVNDTSGTWTDWSSTYQLLTNTPPTHTAPILNSTFGTNEYTENLTVYNQTTADQDNDTIKNIIVWKKDATPISVLNMPFESNVAKDYSGYGNDGTVNGAVWNATGGYDNLGAYHFGGSDNIRVLNSNSISKHQNFTVSVMFKLDSTGTNRRVIYNGIGFNSGYAIEVASDGKIWFSTFTPGGSWGLSSNTTVQAGKWYYVTGTYTNPGSKLYVNGQLEGTNINANYSVPTANLLIGDNFLGYIDEFEIFNRSLSAEQILAKYQNKTDTIVSQETSVGDVWQACMTPNDGVNDGTTLCSNTVTIVFQATPAVVLSTPANNSRINRYNINFSWAYGANQTAYQILVDDNADFTSPEINVTNYTNNSFHIATLSQTSKTYYWKVRLNDTSTGLLTLWSDIYQLLTNTPPTHSTPILNSSLGLNQTIETLFVYNQSTSDADNNTVKNIINWYKNGTSFAMLNMPFEADTARDYSGYGNDGSITGATWNATGGYDSFGAYYFDGGDYIQVANSNSLAPNTNFSVSLWLKIDSLGVDRDVLSKAASYTSGYEIIVADTGEIWFNTFTSGSQWGTVSNMTVQPGRWYHVVGVYGSSGSKLYIDGKQNASNTYANYVSSTQPLLIGNTFLGYIDDIQIFNHSLSSQQVQALYENRTNIIVPQETAVNDVWYAQITPNDANDDGTTLKSNNLTVVAVTDPIPPVVTPITPVDYAVDGDGTIYFHCLVTDNYGLDHISLYFNGNLNQTTNVSSQNITVNFTIPNLPDNTYTWYCDAYDEYNNYNKSQNMTLIVNRTAVPFSSNYSGQTTNWSAEPNLWDVCNAIIDRPGYGKIRWWDCVDVEGENFDWYSKIDYNLAEVVFGLDTSLNASAEITLRNLTWDATPLVLIDGILCPENICSNATYNITDGTAVFNVTHFTNYSTTGNSQLEIWDQTDPDKDNLTKYTFEQIIFYANYSRKNTNLPITGANCTIFFADSSAGMIYNATSTYYEYNRSFSVTGIHYYNVTCSKSGAQTITLTDYVNVSDGIPPTSNSPADQTVDLGQASTIPWILQDDYSPSQYYVERNASLFAGPASWLNNTQLYIWPNNNFLGTWNYTIFYNDTAGNNGIPDTVLVTVIDNSTPSCANFTDPNQPFLANITIDGSFNDWDADLANTINYMTDLPEYAGDPDSVGTADRDLVAFAYTWTDETIYFLFRRVNSGTNEVSMIIYFDYDLDGYMNASDQVVKFVWSGSNRQYNSDLYNYIPSGTADLIGGDGYTMPGSITLNKTLETNILGGSNPGIMLETRVNWTDLGFSGPVPLNFKVSSALGGGTNLPSQIEDNMDTISSLYSSILFEPDHFGAAANGTSVYYNHDLANCGIISETIDLTNVSSQSFNVTYYYPNGSLVTDTDSDGNPDITLGANNYTTLIVKIDIPGSTATGTIDVTDITATPSNINTSSKTVTDTTTIGQIAITPASRVISGTDNMLVTMNYTVYNFGPTSDVLEANVTSSQGWPVWLTYPNGTIITDTDGDNNTDLGTFLPGQSKLLLLKLFIPFNTTYGTLDVSTITINSSVDTSLTTAATLNTTVKPRITLVTDYNRSVGIGDSTYYHLTVSNNWNASDVIDITYTYILNYTTKFLKSDMVTLLTDTDSDTIIDIGTLAPYGSEYSFYVKITVPSNASDGDNESTRVYVNSSLNTSISANATLNTTARVVVTYSDPTHSTEEVNFILGETVYTRAHGLVAINNVYFQWIDPYNNVVKTSTDIPVTSENNADDLLVTNSTTPPGNWTLIVFNAQNDQELGRNYFFLSIGDTTAPVVTLIHPPNGLSTTNTTINFNWTASNGVDTNLTCNLTIDGTVNASNLDSLNNTPRNYSVSGFAPGTHYWNVSCIDDSNNIGYSETRSFTVIVSSNVSVILNFPPNEYVAENASVNFNWTAIDSYYTNLSCNLTINNVLNASNLLTFNNTPRNYSISGFSPGLYYWNVTCGDAGIGYNYSTTRRFYVPTNTSIYAVKFNVSNFTFSSSTYVPGVSIAFNTSAPNTEFVFLSSMNILKLSALGTGTAVWTRVNVDGNIILEEVLRTVQGTDEGSTGTKPVRFNVTLGAHNITMEFRRDPSGSVNINDIDLNLVKFISTHNNIVRYQLTNASYTHSSASYSPSFNWTIPKIFNSSTFMTVKQTVRGSTTANIGYYFRQMPAGDSSPYWGRWLSGATDIGSMSGTYIDEAKEGNQTRSIMSRTTAGTITVNATILDFNLRDNQSNTIANFHVSNNLTNLTLSRNYSAGTYNIANKTVTIRNGTGYFLAMSSTFTTVTGEQTPTYFINSSNLPASSCYSKKERYLSSDTDYGNAFIYMICQNLTVGNTYTFNLWLNVPAGETVTQLDESFNGFEISRFDITSINLPPLPNDIIVPANGSLNKGQINITWYPFSDPNGDPVTYNVSLYYPNGTFYLTINTSTNFTYQLWNSTTVSDGVWIISVKGCDPYGLCASTNNTFTIDNTKPRITLNFPPQNYSTTSQTINFNWTATNGIDTNLTCNLSIDNSVYASNIDSLNNTPTNYTINGLSDGVHFWNVTCWDDANNTNTSLTRQFTIDSTAPSITLNYPPDNFTTRNFSINFNWTASNGVDTNLTCNLTINGTVNASNIDSLNNTPTNYTVSGFSEGDYYWNVTCWDDFNNTNTSETRRFTIFVPYISYTLTLPGEAPVKCNNTPPYPATGSMEFNSTNGTDTNVDACVVGTGACQNSTTPFYIFSNTGNVNLTWIVRLNQSFPSMFNLKANTVYNPATATNITTAAHNLSVNVGINTNASGYFFGDFFNALYVDSTNRDLIHNSTEYP